MCMISDILISNMSYEILCISWEVYHVEEANLDKIESWKQFYIEDMMGMTS